MAGFTIDGLFSNLNTTDIINALLEIEKAPITRFQTKISQNNSKITALQSLNSNLLSLQTSASTLALHGTFQAKTATSSRVDLVTATASSEVSSSTVTVQVQNLARAESIASDPAATFASTSTALGLSGSFFVNNKRVDITNTDTLANVTSKINDQSANVIAAAVQTAPGSFQLTLTSTATGAAGVSLRDASASGILTSGLHLVNAVGDTVANPSGASANSSDFLSQVTTIQSLLGLPGNVPSGTIQISNGSGQTVNVAADLATQTLQGLAAAINTASGGGAISASVQNVSGQFRLVINSGDGGPVALVDQNNVMEAIGLVKSTKTSVIQSGRDAQALINGLQVTRSSNTITDALNGLTINLVSDAEPGTVVNINIAGNTQPLTTAVDSFVSSFNTLRNAISSQTAYNADTKVAGVLMGNSAVSSVESRLSSIIFQNVPLLGSQTLTSLNGGSGVASGSIQITDKSGHTATISLANAKTVDDVIKTINNASTIKVNAKVGSDGKSLVIEDKSSGGGNLTIAESGSTTAANLGILGTTAGTAFAGSAIANPGTMNLTQLGFSLNKDGTLSLDKTKFNSMLSSNPAVVEAVFATATSGIGAQVKTAVDYFTDSTNGQVSYSIKGLEDINKSLSDNILRTNDRVSAKETQLRRQFTAMEQALAKMQQQSNYLTSQLSANSSSSNK